MPAPGAVEAGTGPDPVAVRRGPGGRGLAGRNDRVRPSTPSCFNCRIQLLEAHAGVRGTELPVDTRLDGVAGLRPRGDLRVNLFLRGHARGQGLARQDAQLRFGPVEPAAVPGRIHQTYALRQAARFGGREGVVERGVGMGIQVVADQSQVLRLTVARVIHQRLDLVRPVHGRASGGSVGRAPRAQRLHEQPEGAGAVPHIFVVVGGGPSRLRGLRRPHFGQPLFELFVHADHGMARIVRQAVEIQHYFHRGHEGRLAHGRVAASHPAPERQVVFFSVRRTVS